MLLLPVADGINGNYNDNDPADDKYFVEVHISGFTGGADRAFDIKCFRGYGRRTFWNLDCEGNNCGVNVSGGVTDTNGYDSIHYNIEDPKDEDDYGNLTESEAVGYWKDLLGLMEFSTHGYAGGVGWYRRVYEEDDDDSITELYDPLHKERIKATEVPANLDDILLAILGGCHTGDAPSGSGDSMTTAVANSGVDIVLGWEKTQYKSRSLFVKYFLTRAYQEENTDYGIEWDNYPTVDQALEAAYEDLADEIGAGEGEPDSSNADYVYDNRVVTGSDGETTAKALKLYPARYGAKDN